MNKYLPAVAIIFSSLLLLSLGVYTTYAAPTLNILGRFAIVGGTATTTDANLTVSSSLTITGLASGGTYALTPDSNGKIGTTTLSGSSFSSSSLVGGTGVSVTYSANTTTLTNTGVTSLTATKPLFLNTATGTPTISVSGLAASSSMGYMFWQTTASGALNQYAQLVPGASLTISSSGASTTFNTIQAITSASSPTFAGLTLSGVTSGFVKVSNAGVLTTSTISLTADVTGVLPLANGGTGTTSIPKSFGAVIDRPASADSIYELKFFTEAATLTKLACLSRNGTTTLAINRHPVNSLTTSTLVASIVCGVTNTASTTTFAAHPTSETWTAFEILTTAGTPSSTAITLYYTQ